MSDATYDAATPASDQERSSSTRFLGPLGMEIQAQLIGIMYHYEIEDERRIREHLKKIKTVMVGSKLYEEPITMYLSYDGIRYNDEQGMIMYLHNVERLLMVVLDDEDSCTFGYVTLTEELDVLIMAIKTLGPAIEVADHMVELYRSYFENKNKPAPRNIFVKSSAECESKEKENNDATEKISTLSNTSTTLLSQENLELDDNSIIISAAEVNTTSYKFSAKAGSVMPSAESCMPQKADFQTICHVAINPFTENSFPEDMKPLKPDLEANPQGKPSASISLFECFKAVDEDMESIEQFSARTEISSHMKNESTTKAADSPAIMIERALCEDWKQPVEVYEENKVATLLGYSRFVKDHTVRGQPTPKREKKVKKKKVREEVEIEEEVEVEEEIEIEEEEVTVDEEAFKNNAANALGNESDEQEMFENENLEENCHNLQNILGERLEQLHFEIEDPEETLGQMLERRGNIWK